MNYWKEICECSPTYRLKTEIKQTKSALTSALTANKQQNIASVNSKTLFYTHTFITFLSSLPFPFEKYDSPYSLIVSLFAYNQQQNYRKH